MVCSCPRPGPRREWVTSMSNLIRHTISDLKTSPYSDLLRSPLDPGLVVRGDGSWHLLPSSIPRSTTPTVKPSPGKPLSQLSLTPLPPQSFETSGLLSVMPSDPCGSGLNSSVLSRTGYPLNPSSLLPFPTRV